MLPQLSFYFCLHGISFFIPRREFLNYLTQCQQLPCILLKISWTEWSRNYLESLREMCAFQISGYWWLQINWKRKRGLYVVYVFRVRWNDCHLKNIIKLCFLTGNRTLHLAICTWKLTNYLSISVENYTNNLFSFRSQINIFILKKYNYLSDDKLSMVWY